MRFAAFLILSLALAPAPHAAAQDTLSFEDLSAEADSAWMSAPALDSAVVDSAALDSMALDSAVVAPAVARDYLAETRAAFTPQNRVYAALKVALRFIEPLYLILASLVVLFSGLAAKLRDIAHNLGGRRWVRVLAFLLLYSLLLFVATFPVEWYNGFVIEHRFGLSNQTFVGWLGDQAKAAMLSLFFLGVLPLLWLVYALLARSPRWWWLWLGMGALPLTAGVVLLEPVVVDPVFNKFTPLQDRQLEARIVELAERAGIPGRNVYQVDKSTQTRKYNAYVNGFGVSQRIVLWDTMLQGMEPDEILFVMGHEMGHYVLGHMWKGIVFTWLLSLVIFGLTALVASRALRSFGEAWGFTTLDDVASMPLLAAIMTLVLFVSQPLVNGFSRQLESEADVYGLEITRDNDAAARAYLKIGAQNKSDPEPSALLRFVLYSHPPLAERIRLAARYRPWETGEPNRLYRGE